jgi:metal-responsive CopG/Arc/MetJ family transcriptional regulator
MSTINEEVSRYVARLKGDVESDYDDLVKQTSVRIEIALLANIEVLAETGKVSRNSVINDLLRFGLALIRNELSDEMLKRHDEQVANNIKAILKEVEK